MRRLDPFGTARAAVGVATRDELHTEDPEHADVAYLGWEVARCAEGLDAPDRKALAALAAATLAAGLAGSTRVPTDGRLDAVLDRVGGLAEAQRARALLERAGGTSLEAPLGGVLGVVGARAPLIVEGAWLYAERLRGMDERFCERARARLALTLDLDDKAVKKAVKAVSGEPVPLTDEQRRAVQLALTSPLGLVTGGPGTGKTTIVVSLLRALAWTGVDATAIAVAAPTGKAANRLNEAVEAGLASFAGDIGDLALRDRGARAQTLHALLGWLPDRGTFRRHEGDPLPHRIVIVDEASMVDLAMMDRLFRAMRADARLVLLGDADQLPSVEAGAVFRDLCATLPVARLTVNLRVAREPSARAIVAAAEAINAGSWSALASVAVARRDARDVAFEGVELLGAPWLEAGAAMLARWWESQVESLGDLRGHAERVLFARSGMVAAADEEAARALLDHHGRRRILCATRLPGPDTSASAINERLVARLRATQRGGGRGAGDLVAGAPAMVEQNDHERGLYNGDPGAVARVSLDGGPATLATLFRRRDGVEAIPLDLGPAVVPSFAMTIHKAQGSEYDHVALVLPERDMPLLTRELVYTAVTRARRSVLLVGDPDLLARAIGRRMERWTGVAEGLAAVATAARAPRRSG